MLFELSSLPTAGWLPACLHVNTAIDCQSMLTRLTRKGTRCLYQLRSCSLSAWYRQARPHPLVTML